MIVTAEDMYKYFLAGIKKERTAIVPPSHFNVLINECQEQWVSDKLFLNQYNQKRIEDLQVLRIITDGVQRYNGEVMLPLKAISQAGDMYVFPLPLPASSGSSDYFVQLDGLQLPEMIPSKVNYPRLKRIEAVRVMVVDNTCNGSKRNIVKASVMRSDSKAEIYKNPFRKPGRNIYYELAGNNIYVHSGKGYSVEYVCLEYVREPRKINYDTDINNVVNCEFSPSQQQEIVDLAVIKYIERTVDQRYRTLTYEEMKKNYK